MSTARVSQGRLTSTSDLELGRNEGRAKVSFIGIDFEAIRIGQTVYVKGDQGFYEQLLGGAANVPQGTWLKAPANSGKLAQIAAFTGLPGQLNRQLSTPGSVVKGATTTINGQKVVELKETTKVYKGTLYVSTTGKPYPVLFVKNGGRETGRTTFSEWDQDLSLSAPSPSVDVSTLKG